MSDIFLSYVSNEGCITFIIKGFISILRKSIFIERILVIVEVISEKTLIFNLRFLCHICMDLK